jgi:hypothetical protein
MSRKGLIKKALEGAQPKSIAYPGAVPRKAIRARQSPVGGAVQPKLGAQLSKRVSSGAISQKQASQTARQRRLLENAYGQDWRSKVFGQGGAKGIAGPFAGRQIAAKRSQALARAKRKYNGGTAA